MASVIEVIEEDETHTHSLSILLRDRRLLRRPSRSAFCLNGIGQTVDGDVIVLASVNARPPVRVASARHEMCSAGQNNQDLL
jgi:hypothetical protein